MQRVSSFPMVAEALHDLLVLRLGEGIVNYGAPTKFLTSEYVAIGEIEDGIHDVPVSKSGRKPRDETYLLITNISVTKPGITPKAAWERAFELMGIMEDVVAEDITLGLRDDHPTLRCTWEEFEMQSDQDERGWKTTIIYKMRVKIRLV